MKYNATWLRFFITAFILGCPLFENAYANELTEKIAIFEQQSGIQSWPRLDGCSYAESFVNKTVGDYQCNFQKKCIRTMGWKMPCADTP